MSKLVIFSDLHAHNFTQFATITEDGVNSRLNETLKVVGQITDFCYDNKVNYVFFLGDLFHSRTKIDIDVYSYTWQAFRSLAEVVDKLYILVGNHDQHSKAGDVHSLETFREFAQVIDLPVFQSTGDFTFAAHPFTEDYSRWQAFAELIPGGTDFFFFHQGISEASLGAYPIPLRADIPSSRFPTSRAKWCIGGHYHKNQWLKGLRLGYVGSPLQHDFGERDEEKGFYYWEDHTQDPKFVGTDAPRFYYFADEAHFLASDVDVRKNYVRVVSTSDKLAAAYPGIQIEKVPHLAGDVAVGPGLVQDDETLLKTFLSRSDTSGLDSKLLLQDGLRFLTED